jgi:hypothetical protein
MDVDALSAQPASTPRSSDTSSTQCRQRLRSPPSLTARSTAHSGSSSCRATRNASCLPCNTAMRPASTCSTTARRSSADARAHSLCPRPRESSRLNARDAAPGRDRRADHRVARNVPLMDELRHAGGQQASAPRAAVSCSPRSSRAPPGSATPGWPRPRNSPSVSCARPLNATSRSSTSPPRDALVCEAIRGLSRLLAESCG